MISFFEKSLLEFSFGWCQLFSPWVREKVSWSVSTLAVIPSKIYLKWEQA